LLDSIQRALTDHTDLVISDRVLPLAGLTVTLAEPRKLRKWAWLQHLSEGIRAHALLDHWDAAERHAIQHRGIGDHLMERRQAAIVARLVSGDRDEASQLLADATVTEPWERDVAACLPVMCAPGQQAGTLAAGLAARFTVAEPVPGYAVYRARLGLAIVTLANEANTAESSRAARTVAVEAISSGDGNAAREVPGHEHANSLLTAAQLYSLGCILNDSGLAAGVIPQSHRIASQPAAGSRRGCREPAPFCPAHPGHKRTARVPDERYAQQWRSLTSAHSPNRRIRGKIRHFSRHLLCPAAFAMQFHAQDVWGAPDAVWIS
jgi:hypothetical protein